MRAQVRDGDTEIQEGDGLHIGDCYPRLMREAVRLGISAADCPFDTETYRYTGPVIRWTDGYPWMKSGTPQGELFHEGPIQER